MVLHSRGCGRVARRRIQLDNMGTPVEPDGSRGLLISAILCRIIANLKPVLLRTETWKPADGGTFGVFVFAGYVPATDLVRGVASSYVYTALSVSSSTCSMTLSMQRA